jgi:hypothetical protein
MSSLGSPVCARCRKTPDELDEYIVAAADYKITPDLYVKGFEGTYNRKNGLFLCTPCYLMVGAPSAPGEGWKPGGYIT